MASPLTLLLWVILFVFCSKSTFALSTVVDVEEIVYSVRSADNGAGPMWNFGSTNMVRVGDKIYASGLETLVGVPPLNNTKCNLWTRDMNGWVLTPTDRTGRTREPCPLAVFPKKNRVFLSDNPTLNAPEKAGSGPAHPTLLAFIINNLNAPPTKSTPVWQDVQTPFTEHSYRSFVADGDRNELILFQNVAYSHAEWTFRDSKGTWASQGKLIWPASGEHDSPNPNLNHAPLRVCYPNVALHDRAVHFVGVSDVVEPNEIWRQFKLELTNKAWDYTFRRLFYTSTPDIVKQGFSPWLEIANREETAGRITPGDLWIAPDGAAHIVWAETVLDQRLRDKFFPHKRQRWELNYAVVRDGNVESRQTLLAADEGTLGPIPHLPRFQITSTGELFVFFYVNGTDTMGKPLSENRILAIGKDGTVGVMSVVPMSIPLDNYMTATVRAGSRPSNTLDLLGTALGQPNTVRYARVRLN